MKMLKGKGKRLFSILLAFVILLGTENFTGLYVQAEELSRKEGTERAAIGEPVVITLNTMGGTIASAVQGTEPGSSAWCQTRAGIYQRVLNGYQRLPNPIAPCYSDTVEFDGWYDSMDYTNRIEDVFVESGSMTLYAKWIYREVTGQNENMWYTYNPSMVDVRGLDGESKIQTTYGNGGYGYYCKIGEPANNLETSYDALKLSLPAQTGNSIFAKAKSAYDIYIASLITIDGTYATMHYIVVNTGDADVENFSLAYGADIMIGSDDKAIVTVHQNEQNNSTYIQMEERKSGSVGKVFRLYVQGTSYGITDVDNLWIGLWNSDQYKQHIFDYKTDPTTGGDSAFTCSWINRTIPANSSATWSVKLGVGELSEMEDSSNTVILDANGGIFRDGNEVSNHSGSSIPVASLETPTRIGYKFDGWYLSREGGVRQTGNITESVTLYAHWKEALYNLVNDTVVQSQDNQEVAKETADITIQYGDTKVGREETAEEIIRPGQELNLLLDVTDGFYLPKSIFVDIKGVEGTVHLTEGTGYRYELNSDKTKAEITVLPEYLTGDVIVTTIGHPVPAELPESVEAVAEGGGRSVEMSLGDDGPALNAVVLPEQLPEHTYHYQWYENSEASNQNGGKIPGATDAVYTFPSGRSLGDYYFYCVVTSERNNGQTANQISNYVEVHVKKASRTVSLEDKEELVTGEPVFIGEARVTPDVSDRSQVTYVYYTDEACTRRTTTGNPEEGGSGAAEAGGAPSAVGTYYVKAYVAEDEVYEAAENTTAARLVIKPREHKVDIRVFLDNTQWEEHGRTFCLVGTDDEVVTDLDKVPAGEYRIYDITDIGQDDSGKKQTRMDSGTGGTDTGVRVAVDNQDVWADVNYYTVTFYNEGVPYGEETAQKPQIILSGQQAVQPEDPDPLPGYAFEGWMTGPDGNTEYDFSAEVNQKTQIYAAWSLLELPYRVEHYLQNRDGSYTLKETEQFGGTIGEEKTAVPKIYEGYREDGQNEGRIPSGEVLADGSLVLKLYYNLEEYNINYDLDGGRLPDGKKNPDIYTVISDHILLINPVKPGYVFTGWTESESGILQDEVRIPTGSMGHRSFKANWETVDLPYCVEHYLQDGNGGYTLKETERLSGTIGEEKTAVPKKYEGYREDGQNEGRIPSGEVVVDGSLVLKLYYNLEEYKINYDLDGGQLPGGKENPDMYTVISDEIVLINPEKPGYVFTGWTEPEDSNLRDEIRIPTGSMGDRSFTANWETVDLPYRIEHYLQAYGGGIYALRETEQLSGIIGEEKTATAKEYVGYVENEQNAGRIPSGIISADGSLVLRLYYAPVEYTISYNLDGGELPAGRKNPSVYTIQSDDITLVNPVKPGYIFAGWTETGSSVLSETAKIPAGSTGSRRFRANWTASTETMYWVEHYQENPSGDGYSLADREQLAGVTGTEAVAKAKEYVGFTENTSYIGRIGSGIISVRTPLVLRLYYDRETYVITFNVDTSKAEVHGKTVQVLRHGQAIAKPFVIPKSGYVLSELYDGWDREVPANAEGTATYTAQLNVGGKSLTEAEQTITKTDTDTKDPSGSRFYPLMLQAYGQEKAIRLKWQKIKDADGYILYGSRCGSDMKRIRTIKNGKTTTCTIKNLKEGVYYKYLIVSYQNVEGKKRVTQSSQSAHAVTNGGKNGNPSNVSCKTANITLKKGKTKTLKPSYKETKKIKTHIAKFRFCSDNPEVASVTKKGKVTGTGKGSCNIYVYAQNGHYKKVKVKVTG